MLSVFIQNGFILSGTDRIAFKERLDRNAAVVGMMDRLAVKLTRLKWTVV
jgi:hypothetical protein